MADRPTPSEVLAVITPTARPEQLDANTAAGFAGNIRMCSAFRSPRQAHRQRRTNRSRVRPPKPSRTPKLALAHQNSASSRLDLQVISAILNAHLKTVEGSEALSKLQQEPEGRFGPAQTWTPRAGARDFQRFLISKLRDIRAVVADASLDDTSKSTLMALDIPIRRLEKRSGRSGSTGTRARGPR